MKTQILWKLREEIIPNKPQIIKEIETTITNPLQKKDMK